MTRTTAHQSPSFSPKPLKGGPNSADFHAGRAIALSCPPPSAAPEKPERDTWDGGSFLLGPSAFCLDGLLFAGMSFRHVEC